MAGRRTHRKRHGSLRRIATGWSSSLAATVLLQSKTEKEVFLPAYRVKAVDTTGAGDSFNAGFVYGFLTGKGLEECLACGNACGALNVTAYGGNTGFPDKEGLKEFMGKKKGEETK